MSDYQSINAETDWNRFRTIYNRCTIFAPYTIPLSERLLNDFVIAFTKENTTFARIGSNQSGEGIIHAGIHSMNGKKIGHIFMFFSENNDLANHLLSETEDWFQEQGTTSIYGFWGFPNPYNFILHGRETYAWAGAFPSNNALRNNGYNLLNDIIVMQLHMNELPQPSLPDHPSIEIRNYDLGESELAWQGRVEAWFDNKKVGHCEFYDLKAINKYFNKSIGQITIDTNREFYGMDVAKSLITHAHRSLYERGNRIVMLATGQALFRAIKFYEKLGYKAELIKAYSYIKETKKN